MSRYVIQVTLLDAKRVTIVNTNHSYVNDTLIKNKNVQALHIHVRAHLRTQSPVYRPGRTVI